MAATATPINGTFGNCLKDTKTTATMAEEKVEMSEVPLEEKTGATTETATAAEMAAAATKEPKKPFTIPKFLQKRDKSKEKKPTESMLTETELKEKENLINGESPKKTDAKPKNQWFKRRAMMKCPTEETDGVTKTTACDMTIGMNMIDRDEKNINESVKLQFDDIFGEPEGYHSFDCAWRATFRTFNGVRCICYKVLAAIFAIPCAIIWGLIFALLACLNVWTCVPTGKCMTICFGWLFKMWSFFVRSFFDPLFRSIGLCCGAINVRRHTVVEPRVEIMQA